MRSAVIWSDEEIALVVDAYFEMNDLEQRGKPFVKAEYARRVAAATGRTKGSVEFKFANISAVMRDLEQPWIDGYKPRSNYQASLRSWVEQVIASSGAPESHALHRGDSRGGAEIANAPALTSSSSDSQVSSSRVTSFEDALRQLPERAFGGADVAARPNDAAPDTFWVNGSSAPGADEVLEWIREHLDDDALQVFAFLVGGPGNGKSYLTAALVAGLHEVQTTDDGLAHRVYRYDVGGRSLVLVNDATIARDDRVPRPLTQDIDDAVATGSHFVANVNRGILYEEISTHADTFGEHVVAWLEDSGAHEDPRAQGMATILDRDYVRAARTTLGEDSEVLIVAVFMDTCSLLEVRPRLHGFTGEAASQVTTDRYKITELRERDVTYSRSTPGGSLLFEFVRTFPRLRDAGEEIPSGIDVFAANLKSLESSDVQAGICRILRAAEIASSRRLTYREFWAAISLLIVGEQPERFPNEDPVTWMTGQSGASRDLYLYTELAGMRFHQSLFRARPFAGDGAARLRSSPVTRLTALVDPVRDALPGNLHGGGSGWADPVLDAFSEHALGTPPLLGLLERLPEGDPVKSAVTDFDLELDAVVSDALKTRGLADVAKRRLEQWYGQYLTRLYATAHGIPAFLHELDVWTQVWRAAEGNFALPTAVKDAVLTLLLPPFSPDTPGSEFVLPAFDARALPLSERAEEPRIALTVKPWQWEIKSVARGDHVRVQLSDGKDSVVEIDLDFAVLREALACNVNHVGISEYTHRASPRLERFRATLLRPESADQSRYVVVTDSSYWPFDVGAGR